MNFFQVQRQIWLQNRIDPFNRIDLANYFGISIPSASKDIDYFIKKHPDVWLYNKKLKRYERQIQPIDKPIDADELKALVRTHIPDFDKATLIMRCIAAALEASNTEAA